MNAAAELMDLGYVPFWPLHSHFLHMIHPQDYDTWLAWDFEWIKSCDVVLRLPGYSKGANLEVDFVIMNNIPVVYSIDELKNFTERLNGRVV